MTDFAKATATPVELNLGGKTYKMSPITLKDFGEFEQWMRSRVIRIARDSMLEDMTERERREIMDAAMRHVQQISLTSEEGKQIVSTIDGARMLVWLGLRKNHPNLSIDDVGEMLFDQDAVDEAMQMFDQANEIEDMQQVGKPDSPDSKANSG